MKKVLVTGSRKFTDRSMIWAVLKLHKPTILIHGAAVGADGLAAAWCNYHQDVYQIPIPAKWNILGISAGHARNAVMLALKPDVVLAFLHPNAENRGTKGMMKLAQDAGVPVESFWSA